MAPWSRIKQLTHNLQAQYERWFQRSLRFYHATSDEDCNDVFYTTEHEPSSCCEATVLTTAPHSVKYSVLFAHDESFSYRMNPFKSTVRTSGQFDAGLDLILFWHTQQIHFYLRNVKINEENQNHWFFYYSSLSSGSLYFMNCSFVRF